MKNVYFVGSYHIFTNLVSRLYRGADKSLARPTSRYILFDGENISFDASLVIYIYIYIYIVRVVKSRRMRWAGHVARIGEGRGVHRVLVGKPEGKRPLGRPRRRWEDNIKMALQKVGGSCGDWM